MAVKRVMALLITFLLLAGPVGFMAGNSDAAAANRVAIVTSLKGEVKVKKSGGSKTFKAFKNMSLNEGDTLYTGAKAQAVLSLSSKDADEDSVTVGENSQVDFTKLSDSTGTKSKMSIWAGSMWVKVKSISNASDTFEVETPTSIMGVRGTQFYVSVSPVTGAHQTAVLSGVVRLAANRLTPSATVSLYPEQQIVVANPGGSAIQHQVSPVDVETLIRNASPAIIEAIIKDAGSIHNENEAMIQKLRDYIRQPGAATPSSSFQDVDEQWILNLNASELLANLALESIEEGKFTRESMQKIVDSANLELPQGGKIDLSGSTQQQLEPSERASIERARWLMEQARASKQAKEQERLKQRELSRELLERLENQSAQNKAANELKLEEIRKQAEEALKKKYTEKEWEQYLENKQKAEPESSNPGSSESGSSSGSSGGTVTVPSTPAARLAFSSPYSSGMISNPEAGSRFQLELQLSSFTGSRAIAGYQMKLEYEGDYIVFDEESFVSDSLSYRQSAGLFNVEPEGVDVPNAQSVDIVRSSLASGAGSKGEVTYAVSKFDGSAVSINAQRTVMKLPFKVGALPAGAGQHTAKVRIVELVAVDSSGNPIQSIRLGGELVLQLNKTS